jgi:hypothetical protein
MALENVHLIYHHMEGHEAIPASCLSGEWVWGLKPAQYWLQQWSRNFRFCHQLFSFLVCASASSLERYDLLLKNDKLCKLDVHESVHRDIIMKTSNKMQLHKLIYYS